MNRHLTAAELLDLQLPALPTDKGGLSRLITNEGWRSSPLARETERGWEYHSSLLPAEAQVALLRGDAAVAAPIDNPAWAAFERLPTKAKEIARERLNIVEQVDTLRGGGMLAAEAVALIARPANIATSTLWGWLRLVDGVARADRLPALAPQHKGRTKTADCDPAAWDFLVADYLRAERPSFSACHRRLLDAAAVHGWSPIPASKTLQRRLEKQIPAAARTLARHGRDAAARLYPHQTRDRSMFHAMQAVNADGHKFDVFVKWEDGTIGRPLIVAVQDLGTGMILGHRLAETENWSAVRLAFADVIERHGIPEQCWLDNGRAFASKMLTGGMPNRFRFKVKADEPEGLLTQLGIKVHWTTPYHGQSKPIERAWRDFCEEVAKHPACAGAYTGNRPDAKPENYASKAIPIAEFRTLVAAEIVRHNAREGRRGAGLNGESFLTAFNRSLNADGTIVKRATAAQRRMLLLAAEGVIAQKPRGEIVLARNRYWAEELMAHSGRKVTIRFDPDNLHAPLAVYSNDGRLICEAPIIDATGFGNTAAAQAHSRRVHRFLKGQREVLDLERRMGIREVAELLPKVADPVPMQAPVVRLVTDTDPRPTAQDAAAARASFSRAVRALDELPQGELIPFRAAETG